MKGIIVAVPSDAPVRAWRINGFYASKARARFVALKLFCAMAGVVVKPHKGGYVVLWWL